MGLTSAAQSGDVVELVVYKAYNLGVPLADVTGNLDVTGNISASSSITADGAFYGDGSNLSNIAGVAITQYIAANSLTVLGSPGVSTITRLGATDLNVTGIITANGLSGNVTGAALTITGNATFNSNVTIGGTLTYEDVTNVDALGIVTARAGVNVSGGELKVGSAVTFSGVGVATFIGAAGVAVTITPSTGKVQATTFEGPLTGNVTGDITGDITGAVTGTTGSFSSNLTVGSGITMGSAGVATFSGTGDVHLLDNVHLKVGDESDLQIYHNGSSSVIDEAGSGSLKIQTNGTGVDIQKGTTETIARFIADGSVELYEDNTKRFETSTTGATISGEATADGLIVGSGITFGSAGVATISGTGDLHLLDNIEAKFGDAGDFIIKHNGSDVILRNVTGTGNIRLEPKNGELGLISQPDAETSLYYNNSKKIQTTNDGTVTTGIATATGGLEINADSKKLQIGAGSDLQIYTDGSNSIISHDGDGDLQILAQGSGEDVTIKASENVDLYVSSSEIAVHCDKDGAVQLRHNNNTKLETSSGGISVTGSVAATNYTGDGSALTGVGGEFDITSCLFV